MEKELKNILKNLKLNEDTISTILGGLVIIIIGLLIFNYFKSINPQGEITQEAAQEENSQTKPGDVELVEDNGKNVPKGLPTTYTVQKGDHLWKIAENFYNSGYNWVDIAQVNNLTTPNSIEVNQKLIIPKVEVKQATITVQKTKDTIDSTSYTVQKGDHLWEIAVRSYGDGFAWNKIYTANRELIGNNPSLVEAGMVLTIPR